MVISITRNEKIFSSNPNRTIILNHLSVCETLHNIGLKFLKASRTVLCALGFFVFHSFVFKLLA